MSTHSGTDRARFARRIAGAYFVFSGLWILTSDLLLYRLAEQLPHFMEASLVKGLVFVVVTTGLLYLFVSYQFRPYSEAAERRRAERDLNDLEERYRALFDRSHDCVFLAGFDGAFIDANEAAVKLLGYSREEIPSITLLTLLNADDAARARARLREIADRGSQLESREYRLRRKDGSTVVVEITASVVYRHGRPVAIQGIARDVTDRRQAEESLRESEHRFRVMIEQAISGFYMIENGAFKYVNPRFAEIFGYATPAEVIGLTPAELTAERDRQRVAENLRRRFSGEVESLSYTFTGLRKDGTEVDIGAHGAITSYGGHPAIIGLLQDISERKEAKRKIERYIAQLEQAVQSTINVVATIGELRDPYTHGHESRVGQIAAALAAEMDLTPGQIEGIRVAGYLHDVGKIAVPAEILAKPGGLTSAEMALVREHPQRSHDILKTVPFPWPVAEAAWQHHERLDGSGYPRGLKDTAIILEARILAVADTVESMASHRPYRASLGLDRALTEVEENRGTHYDPQVVDACLRLFREKGYTLPV